MRLRLLGPVEVVDDAGRPVALGGPKERRVLAALAVHLDQPVSEARLLDALWGDEPPATATKTLQSYVSRLRKALAAGDDLRIESVESGYVLRCGPGAVDSAEVEALLGEARLASADGRLEEAADRLRAAEACWRGPVLGDLADEPFALAEASRLEDLRLTIVEERLEVELARGRHAELVGELEALTTRHPVRERIWGARMVALYRSGRQADALRAFQDLRRVLGEGLGIDPSPELRALEEAVLLQSASLDWQPPIPGAAEVTPGSLGPLPTGLVTLLLTDVEGSTRLWDTLPREMDAALRRHDAILVAAVEANGGRLLKSRGEGDSSFSVFSRASGAAAAALAAQAALASEPWPDGAALRVRMAIHMGEAAERDSDYFGPMVNRVARLRALAAGGEILVSRSAAEVLADHVDGGFHVVEVGERSLKDLARTEHVYALVADGAPAALSLASAAGTPPRQEQLERPSLARALARGDLCVGRDEELDRLRVLWGKARDGARQVALLGGEPGVGKTTLAATLARDVHDDGCIVLYGRCDEDLGVAFQPFVESLRSVVTAMPDRQILALGHHATSLTRLLPELAVRLPDLPKPLAADADAERFTLFEAVIALLARVGEEMPVLLVLDDLHWASKPTLLMLRHLLRAEGAMRLLVVGTYRDTEVDRSHAFGEVLADLRRDTAVERFALSGLDRDGVQALVAATAGHELDGAGLELADALRRQTSGNPFFVAEVLRSLAESGAIYQGRDGRWASDLSAESIGLPEGVRDVVGRRLSRLSPATNQVLQVCAVAGPSFGLRLIEAIPDAGDPASVLEALDDAVAAGLLIDDTGTCSFAHALVRQTLLDELTSTRRLRLHHHVAAALEAVSPDDLDALAFHFAEAAPDGVADKAADYALAAARLSRERSAPEEAATHLNRGLEVVELMAPIDLQRRCDLLLELGEIEQWMSSSVSGFQALGHRAAADARSIQSPVRLAQAAAVAFHPAVGALDPAGAALVEEALAVLGDADVDLRVQLLVRLAQYRIESEARFDEGVALAEEGLHLAQQASPNVAALAAVMTWLGLRLLPVDAVLAAFEAVPEDQRSVRLVGEVQRVRGAAALDAGDLAGFEACIDDLGDLAEQTPGPKPQFDLLASTATRGLLAGDWAAVEETLEALISHAGEDLDAINIWSGCHITLMRDRGRLDDLLPMVQSAHLANPDVVAFRTTLAGIQAELGRVDEARETLALVAGQQVATIPTSQVLNLTLATLAEAAARLGDTESCAAAYPRLLESTDKLVMVAGYMYMGATDRFLGILAATLGRFDDAERHFEAALDLESRLGARPWEVRTRTWYARMLLERGALGDGDRARSHLAKALTDADDLDMVAVAAEIRDLL